MNPNLICGFCQNSLYDQGSVIDSVIGPLLVCSTCRALYQINIVINPLSKKYVLSVRALHLPQDEEFYIIRSATDRIPLSEYLPPPSPPAPPVEKDLNISEIIQSSVTPSDFLRKLNGE